MQYLRQVSPPESLIRPPFSYGNPWGGRRRSWTDLRAINPRIRESEPVEGQALHDGLSLAALARHRARASPKDSCGASSMAHASTVSGSASPHTRARVAWIFFSKAHNQFPVGGDESLFGSDLGDDYLLLSNWWERNWNPFHDSLINFRHASGSHSRDQLDDVAREFNSRPRQTLGWMKPCEVLAKTVASTA